MDNSVFTKGGEAERLDALITLCLLSASAINRNVTLNIYLVLISPRALCTVDTLHILGKLEDVICLTLSCLQWMIILPL